MLFSLPLSPNFMSEQSGDGITLDSKHLQVSFLSLLSLFLPSSLSSSSSLSSLIFQSAAQSSSGGMTRHHVDYPFDTATSMAASSLTMSESSSLSSIEENNAMLLAGDSADGHEAYHMHPIHTDFTQVLIAFLIYSLLIPSLSFLFSVISPL